MMKIKENESLVRDTDSNAVLNSDLDALTKYRASRNKSLEKDREIEEIKTKLNIVMETQTQILDLLRRKDK